MKMKGQLGFGTVIELVIVFLIYLGLLPTINSYLATQIATINPTQDLLITVLNLIPTLIGVGIIATIGLVLWNMTRSNQQGYSQ